MQARDLAQATERMTEILAAAEQSADGIRQDAERRMRERIAEGERAAQNRIEAAEAEALEILANAQGEAEKLLKAAHDEARAIVGEASGSAREVLRDGTELSGNLRELSDSLRTNAELLLRDVRLAHAEMTARLDQAAPAGAQHTPSRATPPDVNLDVPEFHPGRR
jgi:cell division septum initiation protein DivIVA